MVYFDFEDVGGSVIVVQYWHDDVSGDMDAADGIYVITGCYVR
jgi:hypothetical protein